ncbi:hypothetical protein [Lysinibacillus sphaericus]|uniref:hypothetical protein n=1 Tax=Lysinibacillus sphaericus TaxID=1421 RepID=UPI00191082F0|nr:hypothetical protein [Lysinibacillus sphaericus]QPA54974.1 hypothetical protein INQ53_02705 [Lysinibacillus sphaericus]QTB27591.1 hypothetical protein J2D51_02705 [Lysinibacillus sphaericus]
MLNREKFFGAFLIDGDFIVARISDNKDLNAIGDYDVKIVDGTNARSVIHII